MCCHSGHKGHCSTKHCPCQQQLLFQLLLCSPPFCKGHPAAGTEENGLAVFYLRREVCRVKWPVASRASLRSSATSKHTQAHTNRDSILEEHQEGKGFHIPTSTRC